MAKGARSNAHKHKRTKRRERAEAHYDKLLDERAEIARKHLENVRDGIPPALPFPFSPQKTLSSSIAQNRQTCVPTARLVSPR